MDIEKLKEQLISDPEVMRLIAKRAFEIYLERRDRYVAHPAEDWLRAESEVLPRLINQMVDHNRRAIAAKDDADPVSSKAAEHMREETSKATAKPSEKKAAAKPAARKAAAKPAASKKPAAKAAPKKSDKSAAKPATKESSDSKPAAKTPARKAAAKPKKTEPKK